MKKGIKILLAIIASIVLVIGILMVLVIKQIIPNPFLDRSDLVCVNESDYGNLIHIEQYIVSFDKWGKANKIHKKYISEFQNEEDAIEAYEMLLEIYGSANNVKIENNRVEQIPDLDEFKEFAVYNKSKKESKKYLIDRAKFNCE